QAWRADLAFQLDPAVMSEEDYICTWGDFQRDYYLPAARVSSAVRTTGHPRFDLYKRRFRGLYDDDVNRLKARYGKFLLFNSNFSTAIDPEGFHNQFSDEAGYSETDPTARLRFIGRWSKFSRTLPEFVYLLHTLAIKRPDVTFVIRPHPSDNIGFWKAAFRGVKNAPVLLEGTVAPWLLASHVMLHDGCTTAVEAAMMGCPIVNFSPVDAPEHEFYVANLFGRRCRTHDEALGAVLEALDN